MTLDECFEKAGKKFPFTATRENVGTYKFEFKTRLGFYITEGGFSFIPSAAEWELYDEPKPKTKMWRWLMTDGYKYIETKFYYATKEAAEKCTSVLVIKPLLYTEIEI